MVSALIYGLIAFVIALPLGAMVANSMTKVFLNLFNIDFNQFHTLQQGDPLSSDFCTCCASDRRAAACPAGCKNYRPPGDCQLWTGRWSPFRRLDRLVEGFGQRLLSSHYATALGNMFRHKGRLLLTQLVLLSPAARSSW